MVKNNTIKNIDWVTVALYLALVIFGWFNIYAANYNPDNPVFFDPNKEYAKQLIWFGLSLLIIWVLFITDSKFYVAFSYFLYGLSVFLLFAVIFLGKEINGAKSWFEIGPVRFQPVELAKVATALTLARIMSAYGFSFKNKKDTLKVFAIALAPFIAILLQNDTGSALVFLVLILPFYREGISGAVLVIGAACAIIATTTLIYENAYILLAIILAFHVYIYLKSNIKTSLISLSIGTATYITLYTLFSALNKTPHIDLFIVISSISSCVYLGYYAIAKRVKVLFHVILFLFGSIVFTLSTDYFFENILQEHQRNRIDVLLGFKSDPLGVGYNVEQSKIAIGSGGLMGKGYLQGTQTKFNFVPEQSTDFIYCTVGEEWGFVGTVTVIGLFLFLMIRLIILSEKQHSVFSRVYGYCVTSIFFFHFAINIGMTIGLAPVIGIPLPFFSYGGSSLWGFTTLLFIFLKLDTNRTELIR